MNRLPDEMILMILNILDSLNDLLKCRLVSKRWNEIIKLIRIRNLQVVEHYPAHGVQMDDFSIDLNRIQFETRRIDFMKSNFMKVIILSRLKQVSFECIDDRIQPGWESLENLLQQFR